MAKLSDAELRYLQQRAYRLKKAYGISLREYDQIKEAQGGTCPLCLRARGLSTPLQVDHDHALEGQVDPRDTVRGLLCGRDNNRLGWFEAKRERVLDYLENPPARGVLDRAG